MVDYLTINKLYQLPYPIPQKNTSLPLNISYFVQNINPVTTGEEYIVIVNTFFANKHYDVLIQKFYGEGSSNKLLGKGSYGEVINVLDLETQTKIIFQITINKPSENLDYGGKDKYELTLLPMNQNLYPLSYQIPIIENQNTNAQDAATAIAIRTAFGSAPRFWEIAIPIGHSRAPMIAAISSDTPGIPTAITRITPSRITPETICLTHVHSTNFRLPSLISSNVAWLSNPTRNSPAMSSFLTCMA